MNLDAEVAVLGACLVDPQAYWRVADCVCGDDFGNPEHRKIWDSIAFVAKDGKDPDVFSVASLLPSSELRIVEISNAPYSSKNVRTYAGLVAESATARRVVSAGQRIAKLSGKDVLAEAQRILASCQPKALSAVRPLRSFLQECQQLMQSRHDATDALTGVPTSLEWLDEMTSGFQRSDLVVIAARPSVGKTGFAIQAALHAASSGRPVFFASLEQSGVQIAERAVAHTAGVSLQRIMQPKRVEESEWPRIVNAMAELSGLPLQMDESGALSVEAISARARQCNADNRLGLIVIDYLQQIIPPKADKMADAIQHVTRALKALAKELAVPVILLSQLNRDGEDRPVLKNLRDSGAIEQDADLVLFLHRPDATQRDLIELIIGKQRNGPADVSTFLHGPGERMRFVPTDERPTPKTQVRGFGRAVA
jgi:replicative DNA helicase